MTQPESPPNNVASPDSLGDRVRSLRLPDRAGSAAPGKLPWVLCLLLLGSTLAFGYQAFRKPHDASADAAKGPPKVQDKTADSGDVVLQAKGYIIPAHQIQVNPQVGGRVEGLYIEEGMRVQQGQILAQIEVTEYEAKWKRAVAKFESARQTFELAR